MHKFVNNKIRNTNFKLDFIGIGAQKSGTTWISKCLKEHPEIFMPKEKELDFWNIKKHCITASQPRKISFKTYTNYFKKAKKNQTKGEFSTHYIYDSKSPSLIYKYFPDIKIIAILRDPVYRAYSQFYHTKKLVQFKIDFEDAIKKYPEFIERGLFYKQLKRYYDLFPRKNIKIIIYEDFNSNPIKIIKKLYKFLNVSPDYIPQNLFKKINTKKIVKNYKIRNFKNNIKNKPLGLKFILALKKIKADKILEKTYLKNAPASYKINSDINNQLIKIYKEDKKKLQTLINKKINNWSF